MLILQHFYIVYTKGKWNANLCASLQMDLKSFLILFVCAFVFVSKSGRSVYKALYTDYQFKVETERKVFSP